MSHQVKKGFSQLTKHSKHFILVCSVNSVNYLTELQPDPVRVCNPSSSPTFILTPSPSKILLFSTLLKVYPTSIFIHSKFQNQDYRNGYSSPSPYSLPPLTFNTYKYVHIRISGYNMRN